MNESKDRTSWKKVSNYSIVIAGVSWILLVVLKKYTWAYQYEVLFFGIIVISVFLFSQLMLLLLKNKKSN